MEKVFWRLMRILILTIAIGPYAFFAWWLLGWSFNASSIALGIAVAFIDMVMERMKR